MPSRLQTRYTETVVPALKAQLGYGTVMQIPRLTKVVLNVGFGRHAKEEKYIDAVEKNLALITGQKPVRNKSTKSISNFKIREGQVIGASVTLRGQRMYEFLDRFIMLTLPRVRDFRGLNPNSFDTKGNYSVGFKEQLAFPEITGVDLGEAVHGIEITVCSTAKNKEEGRALLTELGFPFRKK